MTVAYDGTDYSGYQIQNNAPTIEGVLKEAILQVTGEDVWPRASTPSILFPH